MFIKAYGLGAKEREIKHYSILGMEFVLDILSEKEPEIRFIDNININANK